MGPSAEVSCQRVAVGGLRDQPAPVQLIEDVRMLTPTIFRIVASSVAVAGRRCPRAAPVRRHLSACPASHNRHGRSAALLTPTRGPSTRRNRIAQRQAGPGSSASNRSIPLSSMVIPSAEQRLPGPRASAAGRIAGRRGAPADASAADRTPAPRAAAPRPPHRRCRRRRSRRRGCRGCGRCTARPAGPNITSIARRPHRETSARRRRARVRRAGRRRPRPRRSWRSTPRPVSVGPQQAPRRGDGVHRPAARRSSASPPERFCTSQLAVDTGHAASALFIT